MKRQDICVGGVLMIDGRALVVRRSQLERSSTGYWEFPKGRVEFGEAPEDALKREFLEETRLRVNIGDVHHIYSNTRNSSSRPDVLIHMVEIEYFVKLADGESFDNLKLDPSEHDAWKLVNEAEAEQLDKIYPNKKVSLLSLFN